MIAVYVCDIKPTARKLAEDLLGPISGAGAEKRIFNLIELQDAITNGFVPDITIDFAANTTSELYPFFLRATLKPVLSI